MYKPHKRRTSRDGRWGISGSGSTIPAPHPRIQYPSPTLSCPEPRMRILFITKTGTTGILNSTCNIVMIYTYGKSSHITTRVIHLSYLVVCSFCLYEPQALTKFIAFQSFELTLFRQVTGSKSTKGLDLVVSF